MQPTPSWVRICRYARIANDSGLIRFHLHRQRVKQRRHLAVQSTSRRGKDVPSHRRGSATEQADANTACPPSPVAVLRHEYLHIW